MRYTGHADRCGSRSLSNIVRGRLAFHRRIGGQNNLSAMVPSFKPRLQLVKTNILGSDPVNG